MANKGGTTTPGRGYEETVKRQQGLGEKGGHGAPDERRLFTEEREDNLQGSKEDAALPLGKKPEEDSGES
ncbi:hypothetical protein ACLESO_58630 [Pyxidicoccus sp. 3LG]